MSKFETYSNELVSNVPREHMAEIIELTMKKCSLNMGSAYTSEVQHRAVELITDEYGYLPVMIVVSAMLRGSMGHFGPGRLIPKVINGWLREVIIEYRRDREHKEIEARLNSSGTPVDLNKYPMGSAIIKKIEWLTSGAITSDGYDRIDLKTLAGMIGRKEEPTPYDFGIK